jgi:hypothetical protein
MKMKKGIQIFNKINYHNTDKAIVIGFNLLIYFCIKKVENYYNFLIS